MNEAQWLAAIEDAERRWLDASLKGRCNASRARYVLFGLWPLIELARSGQ